MRILVVEDETKIANALKKGLEYEGYVVDCVHDSDAAIVLLQSVAYDCLIFDWMIPGTYDGAALAAYARRIPVSAGILLLTAKSTIGDKVTGLDSGADDYLTKPFSFDELLARVRALLRRPKNFGGTVLSIGSLRIDTVKKEVRRHDNIVDVTAKEYELLLYLAKNRGRSVSKDELLEHTWSDEDRPLPNTVEAFMKRLREKIDKPFDEPPLLHTKRGFGYILDGDVL